MSKKFSSQSLLIVTCVASVLTLTACGKSSDEKASESPTPPPATAPAPVETPAPATTATATPSANTATATASNGNGEKVYQASCRVCHDTGNLGSPRIGDKAAWQDRIAQGKDVLYSHAINGFTGKTGTMPPKGTSTAPDADIKSAVDYIVAKSQ